MKTSKLVLIATILAIGMLSFTASMDAQAKSDKNAIHITLEEAVTNPDIVQSMYYQLNPGFLDQREGDFTVTVIHQGITVYITGSYDEWVSFFLMEKLIIYNNADVKS